MEIETYSHVYIYRYIPDASRRPSPTPQDFGCISFLWGLPKEMCQKVDVVWFEKLHTLWCSQLGDNNMHFEATATAVLFGAKLQSRAS